MRWIFPKCEEKTGKTCGTSHAVQKISRWHHERGCEGAERIRQGSENGSLGAWWYLMNLQGNGWNLLNFKKNHEDHIAGKGFASMSHYNSAHKVLPMPQAMEWKKLETSPACDLGSVKSKKRGYSGSTKRQKESPLCNIDGHMSPQECRVGTKITEVQKRQSRAPWWQCKRRLWSLCSFYWTGLVCVPDDWRDNNGCYCEITDFVTDKQVMQLSACSHVKLEDAPRLLKNS